MAFATKTAILTELAEIDDRLVSDARVRGVEEVGVYSFTRFRNTVLDLGEAILDLLPASATVTALLARIEKFRIHKVSGVFVKGVEHKGPINRVSFRDEILDLVDDIAVEQGNGTVVADSAAVREAIEQFSVSGPRTRGTEAARPASYPEFRDSMLDVLTDIANALP